ncbi:PREDICTED: uncharacterized protein LOC109581695 isoform X1 [Amphimedon queenslandica]|uniref:Fibronectin type-III domain-containing protein n=1 Tax=Amphimedon queenslandica TaxID=400682 RepID=A0AAN0J487_AMPQE|nr:PREDICTED: uncharacterized protein LOC109581695 isoform X1 [Amphimedon queenslandica]|eukprot:XP_019851566.1 PREDICTED: uncharacterized protein LOC109581695 isoform X1 [Amphimedon queenslandica]
MLKMSLTPLLSLFFVYFSLLFYSVDSCSTVSRSGVSLTGVCPNDTFTVPIGTTLTYECSYSFTSGYYPFWNVSGTELAGGSFIPPGISEYVFDSNIGKATITILTNGNVTMYIQCGLRGVGPNINMDLTSRVRFIETEVVTFGPPSSLSHELRENDTVKLSWLPPLVEAVFTYNIIIMESTNNSLTVTNINITNNTYVIISPRDIVQYTQCKEYQWGVRAAGSNVSLYGFTNITMADTNFTIISAPFVPDELIIFVNDSTSYSLHFNVSLPCDYNDLFNNYTYTLLQRDYCKREINSSLIEITSEQIDDNDGSTVSISVNIESLIHNSTWSVAVSVSNRFGSDTTDYTNITSNSDDGPVINCQSDLLMSSTILSSETTSAMSSTTVFSMFPTSPLPSLPSLTSQAVATETPTLGTSDPNESNSSQIVGPVVGILVAILLLVVAVIVIVIVAVILYKRKRNDDGGSKTVKGKPETNGAQGRNGNGDSNNMGAHSSTNDTNGESMVNDGYQSRQYPSPGNPGPQSPTDPHSNKNNNNIYDKLGALESSNTYEQPDAVELHLGSIASPDPMYQEPGTLMPPSTPGGRSRSKSPSHLNSLYSEPLDSAQATPIRSRCSITPQRFDSQPAMDSGLVDMPGYTEIPANNRKSTISKRKSEIRSPSVPLPPTPVEEEAQHQYADMGEIRKNKVIAPPIVINDDVIYADVTSVS